jgi:hypothetical protein
VRQILHAARTKERVHAASECDHCESENFVPISTEEELKNVDQQYAASPIEINILFITIIDLLDIIHLPVFY